MFWDNFYLLCQKINKKPLNVVSELGISSGSITKWKNGTLPRGETLSKLASYFGVSVDYLLGKEVDQTSDDQKIKELTEMVADMSDDQFSQLAAYAKFLTKDNK